MSIRPRLSILNPALIRPSALKSVARDPSLIWLDKNENLDDVLNTAVQKILSSVPSNALYSYPEAGELYRKLAKWTGISADSFLLTPGSDGVIRLVFEAFVENDDHVVHTFPTFAMYPIYSQVFGAKVYTVNYERKNGRAFLDKGRMLDIILTHKPKLVCLPNPDSPTGTVFSPEELREILTACESVDAVLLLDEAYHPYYNWSAISWTANSKNIIVARTFAKAWGVAGLRIGYAAAHPDTIALLHKMRPMYEASTISVEFMIRMMDHIEEMEASVKRVMEGKQFFETEMKMLGFNVLPTEANFSHVDFGEKKAAIHAGLQNKVLYRKSFGHPSLKSYSRFSIAPKSVMMPVVEWIKQSI